MSANKTDLVQSKGQKLLLISTIAPARSMNGLGSGECVVLHSHCVFLATTYCIAQRSCGKTIHWIQILTEDSSTSVEVASILDE